jgi:hypothetical protein
MLDVDANRRLRDQHGSNLAKLVASAIGRELNVDEFGSLPEGLPELIWPHRISEAPGLVAAYIDRTSAARILECLSERIGMLDGYLGFHEKTYLGFARVCDLSPVALLQVAELTSDSVVFFLERIKGVILVDYYSTPGFKPISVVAQGVSLTHRLSECFGEARR